HHARQNQIRQIGHVLAVLAQARQPYAGVGHRGEQAAVERPLRDQLGELAGSAADEAHVVALELGGEKQEPFLLDLGQLRYLLKKQDALARLIQELERRLRQHGARLGRRPRRVALVQETRRELDAAAGLAGEEQRRAQRGDALQALLQLPHE